MKGTAQATQGGLMRKRRGSRAWKAWAVPSSAAVTGLVRQRGGGITSAAMVTAHAVHIVCAALLVSAC